MKPTTNLTPAARWRLSSLALLLATFTLLAFAPPSTRASSEVPFHASFITQFRSVLEFPFLHLTVTGRGKATHLGTTSAVTTDQLVNVIDGSATATYTLTGAHGDTVILALIFQATDVSGGVTFAGSYTVTGGTGRFEGATGSGVLAGSALFLTETDGIGSFSVAGTIAHPAM